LLFPGPSFILAGMATLTIEEGSSLSCVPEADRVPVKREMPAVKLSPRRQCWQLESFDLTAHSNRDALLDFVGEVEPRTILLDHGEGDSHDWFEDQIRTRHPKIKVIQPQPGQTLQV
jgi:Cft2 family RNA processing exonuclease